MNKIITISLLLASTPGLADEPAAPPPPPVPNDPAMGIGVFIGGHRWSDNNELGQPGLAGQTSVLDESIIFGVRVARRLHAYVTAEAELGLSPTTAAPPTPTTTGNPDAVAIGYRLHALIHPVRFAGDRIEPFALLGAGGFTLASADTSIARNDTDFMWHAGLGAKIRFGRDWGLRLDARVLVPPANSGLVTFDGEILLGIYKTFPPKLVPPPPPPPPPVEAPAPPPAPPPLPPPAPKANDRDGDGVGDEADKCPDEPEDRDGHNDDDGCPDPDDDGDGIPDAADRCPAQPETKNSHEDEDGCPEVPTKP